MRVLIAPDKFKGSLSSPEVCDAVERGLRRRANYYDITKIPVADGGEGTCDILTMHSDGKKISVSTLDPLGRQTEAHYGISGDGKCAFIEMAAASGLHLIKPHERNPAHTSTVGTGLMIRHAISQGIDEIILGIGGSATNDAGIGMATVLGFEFFDAKGRIARPVGMDLTSLREIRHVHDLLGKVTVTVLCDVASPLYGPLGAAFVFAPQKGADRPTVELLDSGLRNFHGIAERTFSINVDFPGAGAGGGMGAGSKIFLGASITSGIEYVIDYVGLKEKISATDVVITGEGKLDSQSLSGKVVAGISEICVNQRKPLVIVTGRNELTWEEMSPLGCKSVISLVDDETTQEEALASARQLLERRIYDLFPF